MAAERRLCIRKMLLFLIFSVIILHVSITKPRHYWAATTSSWIGWALKWCEHFSAKVLSSCFILIIGLISVLKNSALFLLIVSTLLPKCFICIIILHGMRPTSHYLYPLIPHPLKVVWFVPSILFQRLWSFIPNLVSLFPRLNPAWLLRHHPPPQLPPAKPPLLPSAAPAQQALCVWLLPHPLLPPAPPTWNLSA